MKRSDMDELLLLTTKKLGLDDPAIVEKDLYVTDILHALSDTKNKSFQLIFIGGTCLSKAHKVVSRMSEDIDFKIHPLFDSSLNSKSARREISSFRNEILKTIEEKTGLFPKEGQIKKGNNNAFTEILLDYPSVYPRNPELRQQVKIELTVQKIKTRTENLPINSLIYDVFGEKSGMGIKSMPCTSLVETAAEKWAALNRRVADIERQGLKYENPVIRHLFDLHSIVDKREINNEFEKLIPSTILRDREKFKGKSPTFYENTLKELKYGTNVLVENKAWENRYNQFIENMVFQKDVPSYSDAIKSLEVLNTRAFKAIESSKDFQMEFKKNPEKILKYISESTVSKKVKDPEAAKAVLLKIKERLPDYLDKRKELSIPINGKGKGQIEPEVDSSKSRHIKRIVDELDKTR